MIPLHRRGSPTRLIAVGLAWGLSCGLALGLGGCTDPKKALGLSKRSPDEFTVVTRAPLALPPEFALRPPQPGVQRPQELGPVEAARQSVFNPSGQAAAPANPPARAPTIGPVVTPAPRTGVATAPAGSTAPLARPVTGAPSSATRTATPGAASAGEAALLARAGTDRVTPNIRTVVNEETTRMAEADRPFIDKLIFWKEPLEAQSDVVNPSRETQRLQDNAALGKPPNEGEVPIIRRKTPGLFERLF